MNIPFDSGIVQRCALVKGKNHDGTHIAPFPVGEEYLFMKGQPNLKIQSDCNNCLDREPEFFCRLSPASLENFKAIKITNSYQKGARLFIEGQPSEGVYMLCSGRVKLTAHSRHGKALILGISGPGEVLGLSAAVSKCSFETTAEAIEPCQVSFVRSTDFCRFLDQNGDAGMNAIRQLSSQYNTAHAQIRSIALSSCAADKLANLLLEWSKGATPDNGVIRMKMTFSHEELAEMIGTSRETVTRTLKDFRELNLIEIKGSDLYVKDTQELERTIGNGKRIKNVQSSGAQIDLTNGFHA